MSCRDSYNIERPFERIKIKRDYLEIFLPEINYLKYMQSLEIFQGQLSGVCIEDDLIEVVNLKLIRDKLDELKVNHRSTNIKLEALRKSVKEQDEDSLLLQYYENLEHCKNHLNETSKGFFEEIAFYKSFVYDLKALLHIDDALCDIKSTINVLLNNWKNLKESTLRKDIKRVLTKLYETSNFSLNTKFKEIKDLFPKKTSSNSQREEHSKMALNGQENRSVKNLSDCKKLLQKDTPQDHLECLEREPCTCNAPQVPNVFKVEQVCEISSSDSSRNQSAIIEKFENEIDARKENLYKVLSELLVQSRDISGIDNEILTKRTRHEAQTDCFLNRRDEIINDTSLQETEKAKKLQQIDTSISKINTNFEAEIDILENKKLEIRKGAKCKLKDLKRLKKIFTKEHNCIINQLERLKVKILCKEKIDQKIEVLQRNFEKELNNLHEYQGKICNLHLEEGCVSSSSSSESDSSSTLTKTSLSREAELLKVKDVKNDKEMYIKHVLGKPLVQGLAAITVYQPTDPIYYLANYLLHYRYNELSNMRKQLNFEELLIEREKFSRQLEEAKKLSCDPCNMKEEETCN